MGEFMLNEVDHITGVTLTPLKVIEVAEGDVMHAMKVSDFGYAGFGEAYFSMVNGGAVKAWKRHREMTLNLIVPVGAVRFVLYDDRKKSESAGRFQQVTLSKKSYYRLTVPPMIWMGFQGVGDGNNLLLNLADLEHRPEESERRTIDQIDFNWGA